MNPEYIRATYPDGPQKHKPGTTKGRVKDEENKQRALEMHSRDVKIIRISEILGIDQCTIINWIEPVERY